MNDHETANRLELIVFKIRDLEFCVDIRHVREVRGWTTATPIPHAPEYVVGVTNLRGTILPIIDLPAKLGNDKTVPTPRHATIVVENGSQLAGMLVDSVSDIITVTPESMQPTPAVASASTQKFVIGVVTLDDRMISHLSIDCMMPQPNLQAA